MLPSDGNRFGGILRIHLSRVVLGNKMYHQVSRVRGTVYRFFPVYVHCMTQDEYEEACVGYGQFKARWAHVRDIWSDSMYLMQ